MKCAKCGKTEAFYCVMSATSGNLCGKCALDWQPRGYITGMMEFISKEFPKFIEEEPIVAAIKEANEQ